MKYFLCLLCCLVGIELMAQRPGSSYPGAGTSSYPKTASPQTSNDEHIEADTGKIIYNFATNPAQEYIWKDTILNDFHRYWNPAQRGSMPTATLGNLGSPHTDLVYTSHTTVGIDMGWHQFDRYLVNADDIRYYSIKTPFSYVDRTQRSKDDVTTNADVALNYDHKPAFTFQYRKVNQQDAYLYTYQKQVTRNEALAAGFRFQKGRYDSYYSFTNASIKQQNNGGLTQLDTWTQGSNNATYLGNLGANSFTEMSRRSFVLRQYYSFSAKRDSSKSDARQYVAMHNISWETAKYKSYDKSRFGATLQKGDSLILKKYIDFYGQDLYTDLRGLRFFMATQSLQNTFTLSTTRNRTQRQNEAKQQHDLLEVGLSHRAWWIQQAPMSEVRNNLFLTGRFNFAPSNRLRIETDAQYGLAFSNLADYRLSGKLFFDLGKFGNIEAFAISQAYSSTLVQSQVFISNIKAWDNPDFKKTFENSFGGTWNLKKYDFSVAFNNHLIANRIYFNNKNDFNPIQADNILNISQLIIKKDFSFRWLHNENTVILQNVSDNSLIGLPRILNRHSLYIGRRVFASGIPIRLGAEYYYTDAFSPMAYQPLIGQFYVQDAKKNNAKPMLDAYFSARIIIEGSVFRTFVKMENITNVLYTSVANYPQYGRNLRLGFTWQFRN